ncbi:MAG: DUF2934 domain-containing protein [Gammaproteobacteria bacterium]
MTIEEDMPAPDTAPTTSAELRKRAVRYRDMATREITDKMAVQAMTELADQYEAMAARQEAGSTSKGRNASPRSARSPQPASGDEMTGKNQRTRERAYQIWEREGRPAGREIEHWLQAEQELNESPNADSYGEELMVKVPVRRRPAG